uniref:Peptidase A2 domain-containing protein n=1 Tax=Cacopsylla melanoneura TaxID=428564 RepID=A0A8D8X311_9HEMI
MSLNLEELHKKRSSVKARVTRQKNSINGKIEKEEVTIANAEMFYEKMKSLEEELLTVQNSIIEACEADAVEEEEEYYSQVGNDIDNVKMKLLAIMKPVPVFDNTPRSGDSVKSVVQLPTIKLPTFDGSIENWAPFKDLFVELVHNNAELQPIQKFQYLKCCLVGDASCLVQHLPLVSTNYYNAWSILLETYANKYATVSYHLKNIFSVQYLSSDHKVSLKDMLTTVRTNLNALKSLDIDIKSWDIMIIFLLESKIDDKLYQEWVKKVDQKRLPKLEQFYEFLNEMILIAERSDSKIVLGKSGNEYESTQREVYSCVCCKQGRHKLYECDQFKKLQLKERLALINKHNTCFNCLSTNHHAAYNCSSKSVCKFCSRKHHSLLHSNQLNSQANCACNDGHESGSSAEELNTKESQYAAFSSNGTHVSESFEGNLSTTVCTQFGEKTKQQVLLPTAVVKVKDGSGQYHHVRALLDSGSQSCYVSDDCIKKLKFEIKDIPAIKVNGIGGANPLEVSNVCEFTVESRSEDFKIPIKALVVSKVTNQLPAFSMKNIDWNYMSQLSLSDPKFNEPHNVDMIIGAEHFFSVFTDGFLKGPEGYPNLHNSKFGWIVSGQVGNAFVSNASCFHASLDEAMEPCQPCTKVKNFPINHFKTKGNHQVWTNGYQRQTPAR